jgi:hypothetical protein
VEAKEGVETLLGRASTHQEAIVMGCGEISQVSLSSRGKRQGKSCGRGRYWKYTMTNNNGKPVPKQSAQK